MANTFTITSHPYYDQYAQCYQNILMLNVEPAGPLRQRVRRITMPKLSPFSSYQRQQCCGLALVGGRGWSCTNNSGGSCKGALPLMSPDDIPDLVTYLLGNGYQMETQITNMLNQGEVKFDTKNKLVFTVTYYGANPPTITYIR